MLSIIPTPIGNKEDITLRSLRLLEKLSIFFCEDTRTTRKLMRMYDIDARIKQFYSLTSFTNSGQLGQYMSLLQDNDCGLLSEAGTPGLSDPGKQLIKLCWDRNVPFEVLPGANALIPAVVASYMDTTQFVYYGFLPTKKGRQTALRTIVESDIPVFIYESVHRVKKTLEQLRDIDFTGQVHVHRELSKMHEQHLYGTPIELLEKLEKGELVSKGEFVLGIDPRGEDGVTD